MQEANFRLNGDFFLRVFSFNFFFLPPFCWEEKKRSRLKQKGDDSDTLEAKHEGCRRAAKPTHNQNLENTIRKTQQERNEKMKIQKTTTTHGGEQKKFLFASGPASAARGARLREAARRGWAAARSVGGKT